ncbi:MULTISPECIES: DUF1652 domain-containing protein [unclassified Pseudomonas]|uniref:DUF1652 domain-containing protein n=1 Tax=unclassified Pseudomonas TaxID=196821 RepID=UPI00244D525D|nr:MULTISPECIES: DUF1652 domain-containing protein [unclassified Pseudomonas]MDG9929526.1 DUF1652 domain-containing protein [Pseudomonas sp. GD04042]MDH0483596.1 DUF1652 domain-containing protein [Pseudomonas sp. GD04015]MDH0606550.1 DUF1652 domain-containing protein [Pseudomonas sp. GD03869]MDH0893906.1 DUF1652 domain-containing protein [Pseudomonas sp. GD03875]MDH1064425.1 DUF1652 domain-containing protein [Pseudomonas sp. GD03985]
MSSAITLEEAMAIVEQAFLPHACETRADREDASFSFRVFDDSDVELLSQAHVARSQYGDPTRLAGLIELARLELSKDGYELTPWSMPWSNPQIG